MLPGAAGGDGGDGTGFAGEGDGPAAALARFPVQKVNYELGEEIGWPSQVALVARAYDSLPARNGRAPPLSPATTGRRARSPWAAAWPSFRDYS